MVAFGTNEPVAHSTTSTETTAGGQPIARAWLTFEKDFYNVWVQPISGRAPHRLTRFTSGYTYWLGWSTDGKNLAIARGDGRTDAVLLTDFR